jgi:hypothetical protein
MNGSQTIAIDEHRLARYRGMIRVRQLEVGVKNGAKRLSARRKAEDARLRSHHWNCDAGTDYAVVFNLNGGLTRDLPRYLEVDLLLAVYVVHRKNGRWSSIHLDRNSEELCEERKRRRKVDGGGRGAHWPYFVSSLARLRYAGCATRHVI